ncbi:hypothetical protein ACTFIU_009160 [Dictyostelium citrinum]
MLQQIFLQIQMVGTLLHCVPYQSEEIRDHIEYSTLVLPQQNIVVSTPHIFLISTTFNLGNTNLWFPFGCFNGCSISVLCHSNHSDSKFLYTLPYHSSIRS